MEFLKGFFGGLFGGLVGISALLSDWAVMIFCVLKQWWCWLLDFFLFETGVFEMFAQGLELLPDELPAAAGFFSDFYMGINAWLPLTEGLALWGVYGGFMSVVLLVRTVFRFIPTMS